jgi:hypothetical protein
MFPVPSERVRSTGLLFDHSFRTAEALLTRFEKFLQFLAIAAAVILLFGGFLLAYDFPYFPESVNKLDEFIGLGTRGKFMKAGFAVANTRISYATYDKGRDVYLWMVHAQHRHLPPGGVIAVRELRDGRIYTCINGISVMFDELRAFNVSTEADIANNRSISENHARDHCEVMIKAAQPW